MEKLTLNLKEQNRIKVLNQVETKLMSVMQAKEMMGVSERQVWRMLAKY
jgi:hypothetical protein